MNPKTYFIVNDVDRPCQRLIAELRGNQLFYIHRELKDHGPMPTTNATPLEDFGIKLSQVSPHIMIGEQITHDSQARYPNGKIRPWQGATLFTVPL